MYQLDREKSGKFIAQLRREKGLTQKELAEKLFISDKAVSKWETGVSIPDTVLLVPLSEILGVSVTELLLSQRGAKESNIDCDELVKTAISYSEDSAKRTYPHKSAAKIIYPPCLLVGAAGLVAGMNFGASGQTVYTIFLLAAIFGLYFCFFAKDKLPKYYDENKISAVQDAPFRMNVPGLYFNNSNWPHIINCGKIWSCAVLCLYTWLNMAAGLIVPIFWGKYELYVCLALTLGGLFIPMYIVGKKFE